MTYKTREEVPEQYKWDLTHSFLDIKAFKDCYEKTEKAMKKLEKYKGILLKNGKILYEALEQYFDCEKEIIHLDTYASLRLWEELTNTENLKYQRMIEDLSAKFGIETAFWTPELSKLTQGKLEELLTEYPKLKKYNYYLKLKVKQQEHALDEQSEKIVSSLSKGYSTLEYINQNLLASELDYGFIEIDGEKQQITLSNVSTFLRNPDRKVRKEVYERVNQIRDDFKTTIGLNLLNYMKYQDEIAQLSHYKNVIEMRFSEDDVPYKVNETLYKVVEKRIDSYHHYFHILKELLNLDELEPYDIMVNPFSSEKKYSIEEAKEMIKEATTILGPEYSAVINRAFEERWIDFCSYKGKQSGGFCTMNYGNHSNILMHYHGNLDDIMTMAHELGHSVHHLYIQENNGPHNYFPDHIIGEVASLTNEIILTNYFLNKSNDIDEKRSCLYNLLHVIENNLFDACLEGKLETIIYEKLSKQEPVSVDDFSNTITDLKQFYRGHDMAYNEYDGLSWMTRLHYFMPFYLYKYSVSICVACYIGKRIISNDEKMKQQYLRFLYVGKDDNPVELLKTMGIDLEDEKVYNDAIDYFEDLLKDFIELSN